MITVDSGLIAVLAVLATIVAIAWLAAWSNRRTDARQVAELTSEVEDTAALDSYEFYVERAADYATRAERDLTVENAAVVYAILAVVNLKLAEAEL